MAFVAQHPYLMVSLFLLASCLAGAWLAPAQRLPALLSGFLSTPYAFSSPLFVPEYWQPQRVVELVVGPEDLLFSFAAGGLAWLIAARTADRPPELALRLATVTRRYCLWTSGFFGMVLGLRAWCGMRTMPALLVSGVLVGALLLWIRRDLWRLAGWGGLGYGLLYTSVLAIAFRIWPDFSHHWNWRNLTGLALLEVPVEECAYALAFGAAWTLGMAHAFGALRPAAAKRERTEVVLQGVEG